MSILGQLVRTFGVLSLLSIGGANATIPEIHRQVVGGLHWMNETTFANLVAIGQTAPGPNVLVISMIGWHMAGVSGMLAATLAIVLPSGVLALLAGRLMTRYAALEWIGLARRALAPIAVGLMLVIVAAVAGLIVLTRASPFWGSMSGAAVGVAGQLLHVAA